MCSTQGHVNSNEDVVALPAEGVLIAVLDDEVLVFPAGVLVAVLDDDGGSASSLKRFALQSLWLLNLEKGSAAINYF